MQKYFGEDKLAMAMVDDLDSQPHGHSEEILHDDEVAWACHL